MDGHGISLSRTASNKALLHPCVHYYPLRAMEHHFVVPKSPKSIIFPLFSQVLPLLDGWSWDQSYVFHVVFSTKWTPCIFSTKWLWGFGRVMLVPQLVLKWVPLLNGTGCLVESCWRLKTLWKYIQILRFSWTRGPHLVVKFDHACASI